MGSKRQLTLKLRRGGGPFGPTFKILADASQMKAKCVINMHVNLVYKNLDA